MKQTWKRYRPALLILLGMLLLGTGIGSAAAKYIYSTQFTAKVTFTAELAEKIELLEHKAVSTAADASPTSNYKLTDETVVANTYELMPGVDIPKDPYVKITEKTPIPTYLYVEVVDTTSIITVDGTEKPIISYMMGTDWVKMDGTGKNGGTLYYYNPSDSPVLTATGNMQIYLLEGGKDAVVTVSDSYLAHKDDNDVLTFYAYLYEAYKTGDAYTAPEIVFTQNNPTT